MDFLAVFLLEISFTEINCMGHGERIASDKMIVVNMYTVLHVEAST